MATDSPTGAKAMKDNPNVAKYKAALTAGVAMLDSYVALYGAVSEFMECDIIEQTEDKVILSVDRGVLEELISLVLEAKH